MQTAATNRTASLRHIGLLVAIAVLSRLPQLTSPHLLLDGDEAVLGLMARHLLAGDGVPVFFEGQSYGLSIIEVAAGAIAFAVAGAGAIPLKLAMLALWCVGIVFYYLALVRLLGRRAGFLTALLLVLLPAWMVWAMKARGGYLTAFAAAGGLFYVLVRLHDRPRARAWLAAGLLTGLTFLSQRLWLPGLAPIVAAALLRTERRIAAGALYVGGIAAALLSASAASGLSLRALVTSPRARNPDLLGSIPAFLARLETSLTGSYYLWVTITPARVTAVLARVWYGVLLALLVVQLYRLTARRPLWWSHVLCLAVVSTLAASWVMLIAPDARYLLPLAALIVIWLGIEMTDMARHGTMPRTLRAGALSLLLGLGAWSSLEFRHYAYLWTTPSDGHDETERLRRLIDEIQRRGIRYVFSTNGLLQWQLMFYSGEALIARADAERDRFPGYVIDADRALDEGLPVAVIGYAHTMRGIDDWVPPDAIVHVDDKYWLYAGPDKDLLRILGFRFMSDRQITR